MIERAYSADSFTYEQCRVKRELIASENTIALGRPSSSLRLTWADTFMYVHGSVNLMTKMVVNPFPNKPWILRVCSTSLLKTLWEKEKLPVTSNFSFSHSVSYPSGEHSATFIKFQIVVCKLSESGRD